MSIYAHKFKPSIHPGITKAQIRVVVEDHPKTKLDWNQIAMDLSIKHPAAGSYLVTFFNDESCLEGWDGTGLLRDSDYPHWLCRITIETNPKGKIYTDTFGLAVDLETGEQRKDVLC